MHVRCPSAAMADDHTCLMGQDMTGMGTKRNMMMRMKNHAHSVCMILHTHEVRGGMCLFNERCTNSVFYSSITKMQIKMIKLDPVLCMGSNLIRVLLGVEPILYIRIFHLELLEFLTIQPNAFI